MVHRFAALVLGPLPLATLLGSLVLGSVPRAALATEADALPRLRHGVALVIEDGREVPGERSLGWVREGEDPLPGAPPGFSLTVTVARVALAGTDAAGLLVAPGGSAPGTLTMRVDALWCDDALTWTRCRAEIAATFHVDTFRQDTLLLHSTPDGIDALVAGLAAALAKSLSTSPALTALPLPSLDGEAPSLRFGWLDLFDGSRRVGALADAPGGTCVVSERDAVVVPLDDVVGVRAVDVALPGARPGDAWAVARFADGSWVGGTIVPRAFDPETLQIRTSSGVVLLRPRAAPALSRGIWTGRPLRCDDGRGLVGLGPSSASAASGPLPPTAGSGRVPAPPATGTAGLVFVDRRGDLVTLGEVELARGEELYVVPEGASSGRRWERNRLSQAGFVRRVDLPWADERLESYVERNLDQKQEATARLGVGLGVTIGSAVLTGILGNIGLWTGDAGAAVSGALVSGGIPLGMAVSIGATVDRVRAGKRAKRTDRYSNLLEIFTVEELEAAMRGDPSALAPRGSDE